MLDARPPLILVTGPAGSGKSRYCLERFLEQPSRTLTVFPSAGLRMAAERFVENHPACDDDVRFHLDSLQEWSRFVISILDRANVAPPAIAGRIARVAAAARVADQAKGGFFERACGTMGFHERFADLVGELVSAGLTPGTLERAAERANVFDSRFPNKAHSLADLWRAYEKLLGQIGMATHADLPCLALDVLGNTDPPADEIWLDGFERLTQVQMELLSALAERCHVGLTLTWDDRATELFQSTRRLFERLEDRFDLIRVVTSDEPRRHHSKTMVALSLGLFQDTPALGEADVPVWIVDCPARLAEVEWVARWVVRLMRDENLDARDFVVLARDLHAYWPLMEVVLPRFGLSPSRGVDKCVSENPFVRFLLSVLALFRDNWQREAVFGHIASSYAFDGADRWAIRKALRGQRVEHGHRYWMDRAIELQGDGCAAAHRLAALGAWAKRFDGRHTPGEYATMMREMCTELGWTELAADSRAPRRGEDFIAIETAQRVAAAMDQIEALGSEGRMRLPQFIGRWSRLCRLARYTVPAGQGLRVVETPNEVGYTPRVVLVLGLLEGVFPRRLSEDPFLNDEERLELRRVTGAYLPTGLERLEEEQRQFYEAVTLPSERLLLFYPRADEDSESIPSLYLDEVRRALPPDAVQELSVMLAPPPGLPMPSQLAPPQDFALTAEDRLSAAAVGLDGAREAARADDPMLDARLDAWTVLPRFPRITESDAASLAGRRPGAMSVSELETMNRCMFQHWAQYRARLTARTGTITRADQGSLVHAVLWDALALPSDTPLTNRLLAVLDVKLREFPLEGQDWELDILRTYCSRLLVAFAERDARFREAFGLRPTHLEWRFGESETEGRQRDPASTERPFRLELRDGELLLAGSVDRIDTTDGGTTLLALDYKLSGAGRNRIKDMEEAKSLQMPLYALAIEQLFGKDLVSVGYDGLERDERLLVLRLGRERGFPREGLPARSEMRVLGDREWEKITDAVRDRVETLIGRCERADVTPDPSDETCRFCAYGDLCRTRDRRQHDGEPWEEERDDDQP